MRSLVEENKAKALKEIQNLKHDTIKSTKHEIRNPKQCQNSNVQIFKTCCFGDLNFGHSDLFRISIFEFRV